MLFTETKLGAAFIVEPELIEDVRGYFARTWSQVEFAERGLNSLFVESNISFNRKKGTLRGMHFQRDPHAQTKLVRCTRGAIYDVIVDLRADSPTFKQWIGVELTVANQKMLYVPGGFAHGFQTLADDTEVLYQMSEIYVPESSGGVRWNDPAFSIEWPDDQRIIIARDQEYPDFC